MNYDIPIRYLARVYLTEKVSITRKSILGPISEILDAEDPTIESITKINLATGVGSAGTALQTADGWSVVSHEESVDFDCRLSPNATGQRPSLELFCTRAARIFSTVLRVSRQSAHRIACVQEGFLEEKSTGEMDAIACRVLRLPQGLPGVPWEWDWRGVWTERRNFGGFEEDTNSLITIKRASGTFNVQAKLLKKSTGAIETHTKSTPFDRVRVDVDINTSPKNVESRFGAEAVCAYFEQARQWQERLASIATDLISGGE